MPTGEKGPISDALNWNRPRSSVQLTWIRSTAIGVIHEDADGLLLRATIGHAEDPGRIEIRTTANFRESVLFVPPHRRAVCVEPYTCVTDAVNLQQRGVDAGWRELPPEGNWSGVVEFRWNPLE